MAIKGLIGTGRSHLDAALYGMGKATELEGERERANAELAQAEEERDSETLGTILGTVGSLLLKSSDSKVFNTPSSSNNSATVESFKGW